MIALCSDPRLEYKVFFFIRFGAVHSVDNRILLAGLASSAQYL